MKPWVITWSECEELQVLSDTHVFCPTCGLVLEAVKGGGDDHRKHERITVGHPLEMRSECSCGKPDHLGPDATIWLMKEVSMTIQNEWTAEIARLQARIKELEGAIRMLTTFFPEGWVMPLGWEQMVAQAKQSLKGEK